MIADRPLIHLFKVSNRHFLYDVNKNVILKLERDVWNFISDRQMEATNINDPDFFDSNEYGVVKRLINCGFLSSNRVKEIKHPDDEVLLYHLNNKIHKMTLQITQECNLRCDYCAYSGGYDQRYHSSKKMSLETAKKSIDFLISHSKDNKIVNLGFYGGEPFVEFEFIKQCIEYAEANLKGKELTFSITTNGTLLTEDRLKYLEKHNVGLTISLDGPKEFQDKNRKFTFNNCGTFDVVIKNVNLIRNKFPEYYKSKLFFNAVFDPQNDFQCFCNFFDDFDTVKEASVMWSDITPNYSKTHINYNEDFYKKISYENFKLFLSKLNRVSENKVTKLVKSRFSELVRMYNNLKPFEKLPEITHHGGPCIPGAQRLFISVDGFFYPCEKVSEISEIMKIGHINTGFILDKVSKLLNIGEISEENCKNCWAIRFCGICALLADGLDELSLEKKMRACNSTRWDIENKFKDICMLRENGYDFIEGFI